MSKSSKNLAELVPSFKGLRIAVLGDLMLDRFVYGAVERISPEAPVPVILKESEAYYPGGAANVAANIISLGGEPTLIGIVGEDVPANILKGALAESGIEASLVKSCGDVLTTLKTRFVSRGQQIMRLDEERPGALSEDAAGAPPDLPRGIGALLVSDYVKGVIPLWAGALIEQASSLGIPVVVDPKPPNWAFYSGCDVVTPNKGECFSALPPNNSAEPSLELLAETVRELAGAGRVVMTWGEMGLHTWDGETLTSIPSHQVEVYDPTGAGDSLSAALTLSLAAGADLVSAARIANASGAVAVAQPGIATVSAEKVVKVLEGSI